MIREIRKKMRSRLIVRYYSQLEVVDVANDMVTGILYAVTDQSNEIPVYQTTEPVKRQTFMDKSAALETSLLEPWFELPVEYADDSLLNQ